MSEMHAVQFDGNRRPLCLPYYAHCPFPFCIEVVVEQELGRELSGQGACWCFKLIPHC
jgi:hypothetical protein